MAHKHPPATKKSPDELKPGYYNVHWNTQLPGVINGMMSARNHKNGVSSRDSAATVLRKMSEARRD